MSSFQLPDTNSPHRAMSVRSSDAACFRVNRELQAIVRIMRWRYGLRWQLRPFLSNPF
jgi:hypothetical protein